MRGIKYLLIAIFVAFGAYLSVWVMFVGGIVDLIEVVRAEHLDSMEVAIGIAKIVFCSIPFTISAFISSLFID